MALDQLGVPYTHVFSSEINKPARKVIQRLFPPTQEIYTDITVRDNSAAPEVDLYVCGFPCQTFSLMGKKSGLDGSAIYFHVSDYIKRKRPNVFVLENVKNILHLNGGQTFDQIMSSLPKDGYDIDYRVLDSRWFGVPQSRRRVYILGIRRDCLIDPNRSTTCALNQVLSTKIDPPKLSTFLDAVKSEEVGTHHEWCRRVPLNRTERINLSRLRQHIDLNGRTFAFDLGASYRFISKSIRSEEISPCIKAGRTRYFVTRRNTRLSPLDCLRLQGVPLDVAMRIIETNSHPQVYKQAGNAMTVPVIGSVIRAALSRVDMSTNKREEK